MLGLGYPVNHLGRGKECCVLLMSEADGYTTCGEKGLHCSSSLRALIQRSVKLLLRGDGIKAGFGEELDR